MREHQNSLFMIILCFVYVDHCALSIRVTNTSLPGLYDLTYDVGSNVLLSSSVNY